MTNLTHLSDPGRRRRMTAWVALTILAFTSSFAIATLAGCGGSSDKPANPAANPPAAAPAAPAAAPTATAQPAASAASGPTDTLSTASGIRYVFLHHGTGAQARPGQAVSVHYIGTLTSGKKFDSSRDRGQPFSFHLGAHEVIPGWDEGVALLHVGDRAILIIPGNLGYGAQGAPPDIPPNATLVFDVELLAAQ